MFFTCLEIFMARIIDVSISTFRTMIMVRRRSLLIPFLAFLEVFVWFIAARKALNTNMDSILIPVFYSLGYATGTYIGGFLSRKFIHNVNSVEITTFKNNDQLIKELRNSGYGLSIIPLVNSYEDQKELIVVEVTSKNTKEVIDLANQCDAKAFIVVKDTKLVCKGYIK